MKWGKFFSFGLANIVNRVKTWIWDLPFDLPTPSLVELGPRGNMELRKMFHFVCRIPAHDIILTLSPLFCMWGKRLFGIYSFNLALWLLTELCCYPVSDVLIPLSWHMVWLCYVACEKWFNWCCNQSISESTEGSSWYLIVPLFCLTQNLQLVNWATYGCCCS